MMTEGHQRLVKVLKQTACSWLKRIPARQWNVFILKQSRMHHWYLCGLREVNPGDMSNNLLQGSRGQAYVQSACVPSEQIIKIWKILKLSTIRNAREIQVTSIISKPRSSYKDASYEICFDPQTIEELVDTTTDMYQR